LIGSGDSITRRERLALIFRELDRPIRELDVTTSRENLNSHHDGLVPSKEGVPENFYQAMG
jgi:hypothetical protein